jgi:hypothetical protein
VLSPKPLLHIPQTASNRKNPDFIWQQRCQPICQLIFITSPTGIERLIIWIFFKEDIVEGIVKLGAWQSSARHAMRARKTNILPFSLEKLFHFRFLLISATSWLLLDLSKTQGMLIMPGPIFSDTGQSPQLYFKDSSETFVAIIGLINHVQET